MLLKNLILSVEEGEEADIFQFFPKRFVAQKTIETFISQ